MKNRSLFVRGSGVQSFPSQSSEAPLIQASSTPDKPSQRNGAGLRLICGLLLALTTLGLSSCHSAAYYYYKFPEYNYAGRPVPPSKLAQRVMIGVSVNGSSGSLQIVDALRDIRSNVEDTIPEFLDHRIFVRLSRHHSQLPVRVARLCLLEQRRQPDQHQLLHRSVRGLSRHLPVRIQRRRSAADVHPLSTAPKRPPASWRSSTI